LWKTTRCQSGNDAMYASTRGSISYFTIHPTSDVGC
jgi:hypothetical protein